MTTRLRDETSRAQILSRAAAFIAPEHLTEEALWAMSGSPASGAPMVFHGFLRRGVAVALAAAMRAVPVWSRLSTAFRDDTETMAIDETHWPDHPRRAACHYVARPLTAALEPGAMAPEHQDVLRRFLAFAVTSERLRDWIALGTGLTLSGRKSVELAAYGPGDQIVPHQDRILGRVLGGNFYLDEDYQAGSGARLGYRVDGEGTHFVEPLFNSFTLFRIGPDAWHWVEPFQREARGRYTVSVGFHRSG